MAWPGTLPQDFEITGLTEEPPDMLLRTEMDQGPAKLRRRFTAAVRPVEGTMLMTKAQVTTLDTYYVTTLEGGALSDTWHDPRTQSAVSFRFTARPKYTMLGPDTYRVALAMEILP